MPSQHNRRQPKQPRITLAAAILMLAAGLCLPAPALAQTQQLNPVYVDDSPVAAETMSRVRDHLGAGNIDEAVRVLQALLDEQGDRVLGVPGEPDVFISVRESVHRLVFGDARLLDRYRQNIGPRAAAMLERGETAAVERQCLMTAPGFEAALRIAQTQLESAQFEAALRTLVQLEDHPDRRAEPGSAAAQLVAVIAEYLPRADVVALGDRWSRQVGAVSPDAEPVPWPAAALARSQSPIDRAAPLRTEGLVSKPLWSAEYAPPPPLDDSFIKDLPDAGLPRAARDLTVMPAVSGELVFVNDGTTLTAFDQYTLAERWRVNPGAIEAPNVPGGRRPGALLQPNFRGWTLNPPDISAATVGGRTVVAATGRTRSGAANGDTTITAISAPTGRVKWSVELPALDPVLADAVVRGPIAVSEGVAIIAARKAIGERRLLSLILLGLDLETGELLWLRPLASAGMLPYVSQPGGSEFSLVHEGVVYRADRLGAVGAFEVATGRSVWVRRAPVDALSMRDDSTPWRVGGPIVDGDSLFVLAPDQRAILRLDRRTGRLLAQRSTDRFGITPPDYIVKAGRFIAGVGGDQIGFLPIDEFETAQTVVTGRLTPPGIHGRVVVAGELIVAPVSTGLAIFDPADPKREPVRIDLDFPGTVVPVESQLVIADDFRVHSYLLWDVAEAMLLSRMRTQPDDPGPAVTFAELAYRADRPDRVLEAVDTALAAITAKPELRSSVFAARRLFDALRDMTTASLEAPTSPGAASRTGPRLEDSTLVAALVERLGRLAESPDDRVSHFMALGRVAERDDRPADAASAYQHVLDEPALGAAAWRGQQLVIRADLEAARRIEQLIATHGQSVYAAQDAAAAEALAALGAAAPAEQLNGLAARYPLSTLIPRVYLLLAAAYSAPGEEQARLAALEAGLRAAARVPAAEPDAVGSLAGELIDSLVSRGQIASASAALRTVQDRFPNVELRAGERVLDAQQIAADLAMKLADAVRWPRIGAIGTTPVQALAGWTILEPMQAPETPSSPACFATINDTDVALWAVADGQNGQYVKKVWQYRYGDMRVALLRTDAECAYFLMYGSTLNQLIRVAAKPDGKAWGSDKLQPMFDAKDNRARVRAGDPNAGQLFSTPQYGLVTMSDPIFAMDERTIVIVQRNGRAAAFDTDSGRTLWSGRVPVDRIYEIDVAGGVLIIAGEAGEADPAAAAAAGIKPVPGAVPAAGAIGGEYRPIVQTVDARSGRALEQLKDIGGRTHWVLASPDGVSVVLGLDRAIVCFDLRTGRANWTLTLPELVPASQAFIVGDRVVLVTPDQDVRQVSLSTGQLRAEPLAVPASHIDLIRPIDVFAAGPDTSGTGADLVVASPSGMSIFAPDGSLRGIDGLGGIDQMIPPRPAFGRAVTIETLVQTRSASGLTLFNIHQFETSSAKLINSRPIELGAPPNALTLLDGLVAISAGGQTVVLPAPAE